MQTRTRVLVTAVGGDLGQAIIKALRLADPPYDIHGCDADPGSIGGAFVSPCHAVPPATDRDLYVKSLEELCSRHGIAALIPSTEIEILALNALGALPHLATGTAVVCQEPGWFLTYGDKLKCMAALRGRLPMVPFASGTDPTAVEALIAQTGFPVVVKGRRSSGSRSFRVARNREELAQHTAEIASPLVQQYIDGSGGEFSVGVFACEQFTRAIVFLREFAHGLGCSWFAETYEDPAVQDYVLRFAEMSGLRGSANVQVRKSIQGVFLLEVNARFSSLVAARALCGFRDVEWSLELLVGKRLVPPPQRFGHLRFRRFFHEVVDTGEGYASIAEWNPEPRVSAVGCYR